MESSAVTSYSLDGVWQLTFGATRLAHPRELGISGWQTIPATVPGNVELALLDAGTIADPYIGDNVYELRQFEGFQWWYTTEFDAPLYDQSQTVSLVFDGIDCFATIWLNYEEIGTTDNMLIAHQFDVTRRLNQVSTNSLIVRIDSSVTEGRKRVASPAPDLAGYRTESYPVRKAPHSYGWDISPRVVSAGLWRGVRLEVCESTRFRSVYWRTASVSDDGEAAHVTVDWDFCTRYSNIDDLSVVATLERGGEVAASGKRPVVSTADRMEILVEDAKLWWPRGSGEPFLYEGIVELADRDGAVLDSYRCAVGIRTVRLERSEVSTHDQPGEFTFIVNNTPVFIRGTNWVHQDCFHSRDIRHTRKSVSMAADLNCNMIRCWGGNVYEDESFYNECDHAGIMVWQDFSFACALYPQDDVFSHSVWKEAVSIICSLRGHPSLVLWAGDNEVDVLHYWKPGFDMADPNHNRISRDVLRRAVYEYDPSRPYLPSSPYISPAAVRLGNGQKYSPEQHLWGPRGYYKDEFYTASTASFVSEIGYHGCPSVETLEQMFADEYIYPWVDPADSTGTWNPQWQAKAVVALPKATLQVDRNELMRNQIKHLFGVVPDELEDFVFASQAVQAEAMKYFIEFFRAGKWRRSGIIWWNLRDGWPILSDAITDYYFRKKLAYSFIERVQKDVIVAITDPIDGKCPVVVINDLRNPVELQVVVEDVESGETALTCEVTADPNTNAVCGHVAYDEDAPGIWAIAVKISDGTALRNHYLRGAPPFELETYRRLMDSAGLLP